MVYGVWFLNLGWSSHIFFFEDYGQKVTVTILFHFGKLLFKTLIQRTTWESWFWRLLVWPQCGYGPFCSIFNDVTTTGIPCVPRHFESWREMALGAHSIWEFATSSCRATRRKIFLKSRLHTLEELISRGNRSNARQDVQNCGRILQISPSSVYLSFRCHFQKLNAYKRHDVPNKIKKISFLYVASFFFFFNNLSTLHCLFRRTF